jgi:glyoxylase-like metal-dependent hydrolase (beta-lactamase superfamily II)
MKFHAETKGLQEPLGGGTQGATVSVEPLLVGQLHWATEMMEREPGRFAALADLGVMARRSSWPQVPVPAYLIRHPSAGLVLVDTGLHPSVATDAKENMGRMWKFFARPELGPDQDIPAQLRARGLDAKQISVVVMTHLHQDHASGLSEFAASTFVLTEAEWQAATGGKYLANGYRPSQYDYVFDYRTIDYNRPGIDSYASFGRTFDLFGDGSVRLAFTPGHSAGHQSVIARLKERDFVIAGDAIYTTRQLEGGPPQPRPADAHNWRRSLQELRLFKREYPDAVIVPGHDAAAFSSLQPRYE